MFSLKPSSSSRKRIVIVWLLLNFFTVLFIVGHTVTTPIRGEIAYGVNFASEDGMSYALRAFKLMGIDRNVSCEIVESKFNEWAKLDDRANHQLCAPPSTSYDKLRADYIQTQLYGPRLAYPYLISKLYPLIGISSIFWIPIILFLLVLNLQFYLFRNYTKAYLIPFIALFSVLSSKHFILLSLSTAATDLIQSLLVIILLVAIHSKTKLHFLTVISFTVLIISTFNKQSQIFWFVFATVLLAFSNNFDQKIKNRLRTVSLLNIIGQPISYFFVEANWKSFSGGREIGLFPVLNVNNLSEIIFNYLNIFAKVVISDLATITTKDASTLLIFISLLFLTYLFLVKKRFQFINIDLSKLVILISMATLFASFANALIIGHGHIFLRMYLSFLALGYSILIITLTNIIKSSEYNSYIIER